MSRLSTASSAAAWSRRLPCPPRRGWLCGPESRSRTKPSRPSGGATRCAEGPEGAAARARRVAAAKTRRATRARPPAGTPHRISDAAMPPRRSLSRHHRPATVLNTFVCGTDRIGTGTDPIHPDSRLSLASSVAPHRGEIPELKLQRRVWRRRGAGQGGCGTARPSSRRQGQEGRAERQGKQIHEGIEPGGGSSRAVVAATAGGEIVAARRPQVKAWPNASPRCYPAPARLRVLVPLRFRGHTSTPR